MSRHDLTELASFLGEQREKLLALHDKLSDDREARAETGIEAQVEMVDEFMAKHFKGKQQLDLPEADDEKVTATLQDMSMALANICSQYIELYKNKDLRGSRCLKLVEELAELMIGMAHRDEVETLDALADMDYLIKGTAGLLDLPLAEAFTEVHRSNMSKAQVQDALPAEKREKGPDYKKPDLFAILFAYRKEQLSPHRIVWDEEKGRPKCEACDDQLPKMYRDLLKYGRSKCFGRPVL